MLDQVLSDDVLIMPSKGILRACFMSLPVRFLFTLKCRILTEVVFVIQWKFLAYLFNVVSRIYGAAVVDWEQSKVLIILLQMTRWELVASYLKDKKAHFWLSTSGNVENMRLTCLKHKQ